VLTNDHVVAGETSVRLQIGEVAYQARVVATSPAIDLAVLKVFSPNPTQPFLTVGTSAGARVGQEVIAVGSALGVLSNTVTRGIVSAVRRVGQVTLIQTDAAINPGNSGGPLLDTAGRVIGINTAVAGGAQGIGFAIPIDIAKPLLGQASSGQPLARAWLGVRFQTIDPALKAEAGLPVDKGAWIPTAEALARQQEAAGQENPFGQGFDPFGQGAAPVAPAAPQPAIVSGSPAAAAGLVEGDIITAVDGTALDAARPLDLVVSQLAPGEKASLDVLRSGQTVKLEITLGTRPTSV
jgi:serine protease Do